MSKKIVVLDEWKIGFNKYKCPYCGFISGINGIGSHIYFKHMEEGKKIISDVGKKNSVNFTGKPGHSVTEETRKKISEGMKKAHAEGRANNWQDSRRKNGKVGSYPEQFFMRVIENELKDKNYIFQYRVSKYSLDFAWPAKKLYIEIDGSQHENSKEYDKKRDKFLYDNGWVGLRISWSYFYNNTQKVIANVKEFIDNGVISLEKLKETGSNVLKLKGKISVKKNSKTINLKHGNLGRKIDTRTYNYFYDGFYFLQETEVNEYIRKKKILENSNIDFSKFDCFKEIGDLWGTTGQTAARYMKKYFSNYLENK